MKTFTRIIIPLFVAGILSIILVSFNLKNDQPKKIKFIIPKGWPKPAYDFNKNPVTEEGFSLGRRLFYDPLLSRDSTTSCASCHLQYTAFTHIDHPLSHGIEGRIGNRNSLIIANVAWSKTFMWDGGVNNIEVQPLAPIANPAEMDNSLAEIVKRLRKSKSYNEQFKKAFGDSSHITGQLTLKALAQFVLMLQTSNSKYDKVLRKEPGYTLTENEKAGYTLFKKHCAACHKEPLFTDGSYQNNGLEPDTFLKDGGRIKITNKAEDSLKFRVPTLRNIEISYPYMHDGRYRNLEMVLFHYTNAIYKSSTLSDKLKEPIKMSEADKRNIILFLKTLTDKEFLYDKRFSYTPVTASR